MNKYLLQTLQDMSSPQGNITLKIADAQQWMSKVRTDLEDKAETFSQALVNEAVVSYLGDLDNKSDEEGDDDDEDKADEDHEDPADPSGHQGNDDDDTDQPATGPSGGALTDPPPPSTSHSDPPAFKGNDDHPQGTGAAGGQQDTTALVMYKKRNTALVSSISKEMAISTMVSSTGAEMAKSTAMVSSSKGKEKATMGSTDSFTDANPWLHKEFHLAKQVQLREYLQADDMNTDMKKLAALFTVVMQVANSWKLVQYHDRTRCALPKHPVVIHVLDRVPEITIDDTLMPDPPALLYAMRMEETEIPRFYLALYPPHTKPADQLKYIQIVEQIGDWWAKAEELWKEWLTVINEVEQKKAVKEFCTAVGDFKAGMRAWKHHMQVVVKHTNALLQLNIATSKIPEKQIENLASNENTYREIGEILFEARIKANQPEPAGWLVTASHCHKLARARVTKGKKTLYYPQTKEWLPMTPYEQQVLVNEPELSGGEKQRVAIARAFLKAPRLLICDEATSALDSNTEAEILKTLKELSSGRTCVFVAHRLSTIMHCDKILVTDSGLIIEEGTHQALLNRRGVYASMWSLQESEERRKLAPK
ncbi:hypothetical protein L7F22_021251 [Adiantum nelumboides]|nr:hypothetical protein [Adiantum nelumboides]